MRDDWQSQFENSALTPWSGRTHQELAELFRELLLAGHLIDRSGMPHLIERFGRDGMRDVAINEWMAASPIYTKRMQLLLGFVGDTVETMFKGLQFDIGAPHEFLDFRCVVHDEAHGEFTLAHCGALMDVEPMGEDFVLAMCHQIEDPTFDATAAATNPYARVRPIHRPPRVPSDRNPHCHWSVTIDLERDPLPMPAVSVELATSAIAQLALAAPDRSLSVEDGFNDYSRAFDPDFIAEDLSSAALSAVLDEVCLQGHLLTRAYLLQVMERTTPEDARNVGIKQAMGIAGLAAKRFAAAFGAGDGLSRIASVLAIHPLFLPRAYVGVAFESTSDRLLISLPASPSRAEPDGLTWMSLMAEGGNAILESLVTCVDPQAQVARLAPHGETVRWAITIDPNAGPARQPDEVTLTEFSTGATFAFQTRLP